MNFKISTLGIAFILLTQFSKGQSTTPILINEVDKTEVLENECFISRTLLAIKVDDNNWRIASWYWETFQLINYITAQKLIYKHNWTQPMKPIGKRIIGDDLYLVSVVSEMSICPVGSGEIIIPSTPFTVKNAADKEFIIKAEEVSVKVRELSDVVKNKVYSNLFYHMVGDFRFWEKSEPLQKYELGDTVNYSFRISGMGNSSMIELPENSIDGIKILSSAYSNDTIRFEALRARKTFDCQLVFTQPGIYDLSKIFSWDYYSLQEKKIKQIGSQRQVVVKGKPGTSDSNASNHEDINTIIAIDLSESMLIEDYKPTRLKATQTSLQQFISSYKPNVRFVLFAGIAKQGTLASIDSVKANSHLERGTAIGSAIVASMNILKNSKSTNKKIIIIGDGDNTAGFIHTEIASLMAKESGITIHTIGIGKTGLVPFGKDFFGKTRLVDNSYQSASLQKIAELTNGTFNEYESNRNFQQIMKQLMTN